MKKLIIIFYFMLIGCSTCLQPKVIKVPIIIKCADNFTNKQIRLPIQDLSYTSSAESVIKSYAVSVYILNQYNKELIDKLNACN